MDTQGSAAVRPWVERAGAIFPTVIDSENHLSQLYGYKIVPNVIVLDENGVIRYRKFSFSIGNEADADAIQQLLDGKVEQIETQSYLAPYQLSQTERELVETRMRLGTEFFRQDKRDAAIAEWKAALRRDPENFTIRKQIWMAEYPERFHPTIDYPWQQAQLERERAAEITAGVCSPDGCPLPG